MASTTDTSERQQYPHSQAAELLPEYALGLLAEPDAVAVRQHLAGCPVCQRELAAFQATVDLLAFTAPPAAPLPATRQALFARVAAGANAPERTASVHEPTGSTDAPPRPVVTPIARLPHWRLLAVTALATAATLALLFWNIALQRQLGQERERYTALATQTAEQNAIARLLNSPTAAKSLTESDLTPRPVGYIYSDPDSAIALVLAYRMPPLPPGKRYQLWLIRPDGQRDSGGLFTVDANGNGQLLVRSNAPFGQYRAVGITAEPWAGSPGPTSPRIVGGQLQ